MVKHNLTKANNILNTINTELDNLKVTMEILRSFELSVHTLDMLDEDDITTLHNVDMLIESIVEKLSDLDII